MHIVYTTQTAGFEKGMSYRNPRHFDRVETAAEKVTVVGDWPEIVAAYKAAEIEVESTNSTDGAVTDPRRMNVPELKSWLAERGIEFDAGAKKAELQGLIPQQEGGETEPTTED